MVSRAFTHLIPNAVLSLLKLQIIFRSISEYNNPETLRLLNFASSFISQLNTSLHEKNHFLSLKQAEFEEQINAERTKNEELQNKLDDLEYEVTKARMRNGKLETTLIETQVMFCFIKLNPIILS